MSTDRVTDKKQPVTLTWEDDENQVITFDATISEIHSASAEVTSHPVEKGIDITDHIRRMPDELNITGIVTDTPLVVTTQDQEASPASTGGDRNQRAISAYEFLIQSKDEGRLINVFTKLRDYRNMAMVSINVVRDANESRIIRATIELREILIAVTEQVEAPIPIKTAAPARRGKRKQGKKTKEGETESNKAKSRSVLDKFIEKLAKAF